MSAAAAARLALNVAVGGPSLDADIVMLNELVDDLDLAAAKAVVLDLSLLTAGVLLAYQRRHPAVDAGEFLAGWALTRARAEDPS